MKAREKIMKAVCMAVLAVLSLLMLTGRGQTSVEATGYVVVEDFESYLNNSELWSVWNDYWVNGSNAEIFLELDPNIVQDSNKAVMLWYDNSFTMGGKYIGSWMDANPVDLEVDPDWTVSGANTLVVHFRGSAGNSATINDKMWLELADTSSNVGLALYEGDANDVTEEWWHEWDISLWLFDACGVNLTAVEWVAIGFGGYQRTGQVAAGGDGVVHFDDIRLEHTVTEVSGDINVVNPSFEFDKDGAQIMCHTEIENVADWQTTGFGWSGVDPYCIGDVNYDPCATDENICGSCGGGDGCRCWAATHGICYCYVQAAGMSLYQELDPCEANTVIAASREYTLTFDAMSEIYAGSVDFIEIVPSLFYGEGENNHIEVASESYLLPVWIGEVNEWEHEWTRDLTVSWVSAANHPSIGNALGVKFTVPSAGGGVRAYTVIDNVRLKYRVLSIDVGVDIKPEFCPNYLSVNSRGTLSVAILGTEVFDVNEVDVASVRLNGVASVGHSYEDVATPVADGNECDCNTEGADGYLDLELTFKIQDLVDTFPDVNGGDVLSLALEGALTDSTAIEGSDCVVIRGKP